MQFFPPCEIVFGNMHMKLDRFLIFSSQVQGFKFYFSLSGILTYSTLHLIIIMYISFLSLGVLYVIDELDFEQKQSYELTVRAVDSVSGVNSDVLVHVQVEDVNDCPPEFVSDSYTVAVSEAATFGSPLLKVYAHDNDTGICLYIMYSS